MSEAKRIWVDAEVHLFPKEWCDPGWRPPESEEVLLRTVYDHPERDLALKNAHVEPLLTEMELSGIDKAVIMGLPWLSAGLCDMNNSAIAEAVEQYPDRFIGLGVLPAPDKVKPQHAIRRIQEIQNLRGVKVIPAWQGWKLDDEVMDPAYAEMAERELVLFPHTDHGYLPDKNFDLPSRLLNVARRHPTLKIAAPHLGGMLAAYGLHPPLRDELQNFLFIGTVPTTMPMIRWAVEAVGDHQVAFGTDFPFNPDHRQGGMKETLETMGFSGEQLDRIAGLNTLTFFGVEP